MERGIHNHQKKIALVNDFSGFGRCSIAVELPIISHMKVQCCPIPTSVFSNHTGFSSFYMTDFTEHMNAYLEEWKKLNLEFNAISTGFLGSVEQIEIVKKMIHNFRTEKTKIIIDPVMGDYGKTYPTYPLELCHRMKELISFADILTPNVTEACILTDTPYHDLWNMNELETLAKRLSEQGPEQVVITGVPQGDDLYNLCYDCEKGTNIIMTHKVDVQRSGTGDVFAAIISADAVNGIPFEQSVQKAADFICKCIERSMELEIPVTDGVCFEEVLDQLPVY